MIHVTAYELKQAAESLPDPSSTFDSTHHVYLNNPDRKLTFNKVVRGDGLAEAWHNVWALAHEAEPPVHSAVSDEEFDSIIDAMQNAEQQVLLNVANDLLADMEANTLRTVANWCDERAEYAEAEIARTCEEALAREDANLPAFTLHSPWPTSEVEKRIDPLFGELFNRDGRPGGRTYDDDANYTPSLEELQDAADARGEPGPLDNDPVVVEEDKAEFDLWEAAKAIREAAHAYNTLVNKASRDGNVRVDTYAWPGDGTICVDSIILEMAL